MPASTSTPRSSSSRMIACAAPSVVSPSNGAVAGQEAAGLVDRRQHRQAVHARELEVLGTRARRDVDDPGALVERDLVPGDDAMPDPFLGGEVVERPVVLEPDQVLALEDVVVVAPLLGQPPAAVAQPVLGVRLDGRGDVCGQRPRRRRPDDQRLAVAVGQRGSGRTATGARARGSSPRPACSCCESEVPQRGHHCVERWPLKSHSRARHSFRKRQMYSMFVSEKVR